MGEQGSRGSGADRRTGERSFCSLFHADPGPGERDGDQPAFRAVSSGTDEQVREAVQRSVLHQKLWEQEAPPTGERAPSISHVVDGVYVTSRTVWPKTGERDGSRARDSGTRDSGARDSATQDSGTRDSGTRGSATQDSATQDSATRGSATRGSGTEGSRAEGSGAEGSGTQGSSTQGSSTQGSSADASRTEGPRTEDSGTQDSGTQDSGADGSGLLTPGAHGSSHHGSSHHDSCTHVLATRDPRTYGVVRPAQLWEAPCWQDEAPSTADCPAVPGDPEPGLGVDALREWVLGHDEVEEWLLALHSALEGVLLGGGKRIVFIGADPGEVLRWIAAGTLLLPRKLALQVDFQVYAAHPQRSGHAVLAYHPEHTGHFARDDGEFAVFDLAAGRCSEVAPTEGALHWVPRFLRADPYDVINAIELAHVFARNSGEQFPSSGDRWASTVRMLDEQAPEQRAVLAGWLARSPERSTAHVRQAVIEAVLAAGPDVSALRELVAGAGTDALAGQVRIALLWAELDAVMRGHQLDERAPQPAREWLGEERTAASELVAATAAKTSSTRMDALLRTATRFGVEPEVCRFGESARHFVDWWLDHPDAELDPARWSCRDQVVDLLRRGLSQRLGGERAEQTSEDVQRHWWPLLAPGVRDPFVAADALAASAAVQHGGQARADVIAELREHLERHQEGTGSPEVVQAVWSALFGLSAPTADEALDVLGPAPVVPKAVAREVFSLVRRATLTDRHLDLLRRMAELNQTPEPESLLRLWQEDGKLRFWITRFRRNPRPDTATDLAEVSLRVFSARAGEVLDVLFGAGLSLAAAVTENGGDDLRSMLGRELPEVWSTSADATRADAAVALAFATAWNGGHTEFRSHIDAELEKWAGEHGQDDRRRIRHLLRTVNTELVTGWHEWLRELQSQQGKRKRRRR